MRQRFLNRSFVSVLLICVLSVCTTPIWSADLKRTVAFDIPAQPLESALIAFGLQANLQVVVAPGATWGINAPKVSGTLSTGKALTELLRATGLRYKELGDKIAVFGESEGSPSRPVAVITAVQVESVSPFSRTVIKDENSSGNTDTAATRDQSAPSQAQLTQVIVTAEKREERIQDVPVPLDAISTQSLLESNQVSLTDYFNSVPALNVTIGGYRGTPDISIRGISSGSVQSPTVGVMIDDTPYGASTATSLGFSIPDLDPSGLERIEVLRGPQGTLYGASSMGGLLKYVTVDPSTSAVSGRLEAGTSGVYNGRQPGYSVRGATNLPVTDTFAVRLSAFTRQDPGYIDDPGLQLRGVNWGVAYGGQFLSLWRPSETLSLKLSAIYQDNNVHGTNGTYQLPGLGDLQQTNLLRNVGGHQTRDQAYSATLKATLGRVQLTSVTGYGESRLSDSFDYSYLFGPYVQPTFGVSGVAFHENARTDKFSQEIRLLVPINERFDWLFGLFYTHEDSLVHQDDYVIDPATGKQATGPYNGVFYSGPFPSTYKEYAAFGDITFHITDAFDVQLGGRETQYRRTFSQSITGSFAQVVIPEVESTGNAFTYLLTPRLKLSPDLMVYARLASGYRPGGPNAHNPLAPDLPPYKPDKTENFEVGSKGDFFNHRLTFDASIFYIDWKNIQLGIVERTKGTYESNGGSAKSQGVELSLESRPLEGMTLSAWATWSDAVLTQTFPPTSLSVGMDGDRLPFSTKFSSNFSIDQSFPVGRITGFVGGAVSYTGNHLGNFQTSPERQYYPAYAKVNMHLGMTEDSLTINAYINNLTDRRGLLSGGIDAFPPYYFEYIQPRTIGVTVSKLL